MQMQHLVLIMGITWQDRLGNVDTGESMRPKFGATSVKQFHPMGRTFSWNGRLNATEYNTLLTYRAKIIRGCDLRTH